MVDGTLGIAQWDAQCAHVYLSSSAASLLGVPVGEPRPVSMLFALMLEGDRPRVRQDCRKALRDGVERMRTRFALATDPHRHLQAIVQLERAPSGRVVGFLATLIDVSLQTEMVQALSESERRLGEAQDVARLAHWEWDYQKNRATFSPGARRLLRRGEDWQPTLADLRMLAPPDQRAWIAELFHETYERKLPSLRYEVQYTDDDGTLTYLHTVGKIEYDSDGRPRRLLATIQDISEVRSYRRQLHSLAFFDPLTGLPNRAQFIDRLRESIANQTNQNAQIGLLLLDLDRFNDINDSLGHAAGDTLLKQAAERLRSTLRGADMVGRLSADEFAVLVPEVKQASDLLGVAQKLRNAFHAPFIISDQEVFVSTSLGGAMYPMQAQDVEQLLQFSDAALHHAKAQGRNNFQLYASELTSKAAERLALEAELRRALERGELELYFQPQLDLPTGRLVGAEALMRWNHPTRGLVSPDEFIPLAEQTGLIIAMGEWALGEACGQAARWNADHDHEHEVKIAVNISARQLGRHFTGMVRDALARHQCKPQWLELEITESLLLEGHEDVQTPLREVAELGVSIAIDDFGIGYSALSYLTRFPIRILKIDRSFVRQLPNERSNAELVKAIVSLGHSLNMALVAEGVESTEQARHLNALGCQTAQGYLFGKPMSRQAFERSMLLQRRAISTTMAGLLA